MTSHSFETEFNQSIMVSKLTDIEPYVEQFELILPDKPIAPFVDFRLVVKASGFDLPCNGSWFQITVAGQGLPNATVISQPIGETLNVGITGEWHIELQAPIAEGNYLVQATMNSVETDLPPIKIPVSVKVTPESGFHRSLIHDVLISIAFLGAALGIVWLALSVEVESDEVWNKFFSNESTESSTILDPTLETSAIDPSSKRAEEIVSNLPPEDTKTKAFINGLLEQSFNHSSILVRQQAWRELSQFIDSQAADENPHVLKVLQLRSQHKQQMEAWIASNKNSQELLKRLKVLAFVDDDNAQLWLGKFYASGRIVVKHLGKAWQWYQRAASKGNIEAQQLLDKLEASADQLLNSSKLEERLQGYEIAKETASAGGVNAQLWMGYRYESGDGVTQDLVTAGNWYRKAAGQGNSFASKELSRILDVIAKKNK